MPDGKEKIPSLAELTGIPGMGQALPQQGPAVKEPDPASPAPKLPEHYFTQRKEQKTALDAWQQIINAAGAYNADLEGKARSYYKGLPVEESDIKQYKAELHAQRVAAHQRETEAKNKAFLQEYGDTHFRNSVLGVDEYRGLIDNARLLKPVSRDNSPITTVASAIIPFVSAGGDYYSKADQERLKKRNSKASDAAPVDMDEALDADNNVRPEFMRKLYDATGGNQKAMRQMFRDFMEGKRTEFADPHRESIAGMEAQKKMDDLHASALTLPFYYMERYKSGVEGGLFHMGNFMTNIVGGGYTEAFDKIFGTEHGDQARKYVDAMHRYERLNGARTASTESQNWYNLDHVLSSGAHMIGEFAPSTLLGAGSGRGVAGALERRLALLGVQDGLKGAAARFGAKALGDSFTGRLLQNSIHMMKTAYPQVYAGYVEDGLAKGYDEDEAMARAFPHAFVNTIALSVPGSVARAGINPRSLPGKIMASATPQSRWNAVMGTAGRFMKAPATGAAAFAAGSLADSYMNWQEDKASGRDGVTDNAGFIDYQNFQLLKAEGKIHPQTTFEEFVESPEAQQYSYAHAFKDAAEQAAFGLIWGVAEKAIHGHGVLPNAVQADYIRMAANDPATFRASVERNVSRGNMDAKQGRALVKFVERLAPTIRQAEQLGFDGRAATQYAMEAERLKETVKELEELHNRGKIVNEVDAKGKKVPTLYGQEADGKFSRAAGMALEDRIKDLTRKKDASEHAIKQLTEGTYTKGRTITGRRMMEMSARFSPGDGLHAGQAMDIVDNGPYRTSVEPIGHFMSDPQVRNLVERMRNYRANTTQGEAGILRRSENADATVKTAGAPLTPEEMRWRQQNSDLAKDAFAEPGKDNEVEGGVMIEAGDNLAAFKPQNSNPVVIDRNGKIIDGHKRIAYALVHGIDHFEIARPLRVADVAEHIKDGHQNPTPLSEGKKERELTTPEQEAFDWAKPIFEGHMKLTSEPTPAELEAGITNKETRAYYAAARAMIEQGMNKEQVSELLDRLQPDGKAISPAMVEALYNEINAARANGEANPVPPPAPEKKTEEAEGEEAEEDMQDDMLASSPFWDKTTNSLKEGYRFGEPGWEEVAAWMDNRNGEQGEPVEAPGEEAPPAAKIPEGHISVDEVTENNKTFYEEPINEEAVAALQAEAHAFKEPIQVWRDPESGAIHVLHGRNRLEAARRAGIPTIPARMRTDLDFKGAKRYAAAHRLLRDGEVLADKPVRYITNDGRYAVAYDGVQLTVTNLETGKDAVAKYRSAAIREAQDKYRFSEGVQLDADVFERVENEEGWGYEALEHSYNPAEIAGAWMAQAPESSSLTHKDRVIAENLGRITTDSFYKEGDRNNSKDDPGIRLHYLANERGNESNQGSPIDQRAEELSNIAGVPISVGDIIEFIRTHPNGAESALRGNESQLSKDLAARFERLTGFPLTMDLANRAIAQEREGLSPAEKAIFDQEIESHEQLQKLYDEAVQRGEIELGSQDVRPEEGEGAESGGSEAGGGEPEGPTGRQAGNNLAARRFGQLTVLASKEVIAESGWTENGDAGFKALYIAMGKMFGKGTALVITDNAHSAEYWKETHPEFEDPTLAPEGWFSPERNAVYLNIEKAPPSTLMDELGHLWVNWAKKHAPTIWEMGRGLAEQHSPEFKYMEAVARGEMPERPGEMSLEEADRLRRYAEYYGAREGGREVMIEEALTIAIQQQGRMIAGKKEKARTVDTETGAVAKGNWGKWLEALWQNVKRAAGFGKMSTKEFASLDLKGFTEAVTAELAKGQPLTKVIKDALDADLKGEKPKDKDQKKAEDIDEALGDQIGNIETIDNKLLGTAVDALSPSLIVDMVRDENAPLLDNLLELVKGTSHYKQRLGHINEDFRPTAALIDIIGDPHLLVTATDKRLMGGIPGGMVQAEVTGPIGEVYEMIADAIRKGGAGIEGITPQQIEGITAASVAKALAARAQREAGRLKLPKWKKVKEQNPQPKKKPAPGPKDNGAPPAVPKGKPMNEANKKRLDNLRDLFSLPERRTFTDAEGKEIQTKPLPEGLEIVDGFYSPIEKKVLEFKQEKASATKWKEIIGTKTDEARFTGVADWLAGMKPDQTVSRKEIMDFMKENRIEIQEVVNNDRRTEEGWSEAKKALRAEGFEVIDDTTSEYPGVMDPDAVKILHPRPENAEYTEEEREELEDFDQEVIHLDELPNHLQDLLEPYMSDAEAGTQYEEYQTPGRAKNYKEVLITIPPKDLSKPVDARYEELAKQRTQLTIQIDNLRAEFRKVEMEQLRTPLEDYKATKDAFKERFDAIDKQINDLIEKREALREESESYGTKHEPVKFRSNHFDQANIVAHLRMNVREAVEPRSAAEEARLAENRRKYDEFEERLPELAYNLRIAQRALDAVRKPQEDAIQAEVYRQQKEHNDRFRAGQEPRAMDAGDVREELTRRYAELAEQQSPELIAYRAASDAISALRQEQGKYYERPAPPIKATGDKVLFLEEVQSDWGQKAKKDGFKQPADPAKLAELERVRDEAQAEYDNLDFKNLPLSKIWDHPTTLKLNRANEAVREYERAQMEGVNEAPYIGDTNAWVKLGLRYAIRHAVAEGVNKIAWTSGEQQNERYDLSKQVDYIHAFKNEDGTIEIDAVKDGSTAVREKNLKPEGLEAVVGKDLANKILADAEAHEYLPNEDNLIKKYEGEDLKVGGKGMKGFYGDPKEGGEGIVGKVAKALVKELTGKEGKVETTKIQTDTNHTSTTPREPKVSEQHSIAITPELRAAVEKGQARFALPEQKDPEKEGKRHSAAIEFVRGAVEEDSIHSFADLLTSAYDMLGADKLDVLYPYLKSAYLAYQGHAADEVLDKMDDLKAVRSFDYEGFKTQLLEDAPGTEPSLESDSSRGDAGDAMGGQNVQPSDGRGPMGGAGPRGEEAPDADAGGKPESDKLFPDVLPPTGGTQSHPELFGEQRRPGELPDDNAGTGKRAGSGWYSHEGQIPVGNRRTPVVRFTPEGAGDPRYASQLEAQRQAENIPVVIGDRENIRQTLPFLMESQQDDVHFAEQRLEKEDGYGVLFANATGTGKTYLALGMVKRMLRAGKNNIIIVAPNDAVIREWTQSAPSLGVEVHKLKDTKDAPEGVVITTYANYIDNDAIAKRKNDAVFFDETHKVMGSEGADATRRLSTMHALTLHPAGIQALAEKTNRPQYDKFMAAVARRDAAGRYATDEMKNEVKRLYDQWNTVLAQVRDYVARNQGAARPRAVFLSATPFKYRENTQWAAGYLFNYPKTPETRGYNEPDGYQSFMIQHFGYRMRYNKLTQPDSKVNVGMMERAFNEHLHKEGVMSTRILNMESDYQRTFATVPSEVGTKIDEGLEFLRNGNDGYYNDLHGLIRKKFNYLQRARLLEAIKAHEFIPTIKALHEQGRKVVVFYDYNEGGAFSPFRFDEFDPNTLVGAGRGDNRQEIRLGDLVNLFYAERPDLAEIDFEHIGTPLETLRAAFPESIRVYNGLETKAAKERAIKDFIDDAKAGANLLMVQSDAAEGWSAHDKTGRFPRAMINLGLPGAPDKIIQTEGRIYRSGQHPDSHSLFIYGNTGTMWERGAFAHKIAGRVGTAENLGMGKYARGMKQSIIDAFEASAPFTPGPNDGRGSRDADKAYMVDESNIFDRAKTLYYAQQKKTQATKAKEGTDYFATPEPLGLKMNDWLDLRAGEDGLEPSAGHGAIARWMNDEANRTIIEPSTYLHNLALLNANGAKAIQDQFENHHIVNKYDGIVMNPPFGTAGATASEHVKKATEHLRVGGRIVALVPVGSFNAKFDKWFYGTDDRGRQLHPDLHLSARILLPSSTFERAGTAVNTQILIIDRLPEGYDKGSPQRNIDLTYAKDVNEFFDIIRDMDVPERIELPEEGEGDVAAKVAALRAGKMPAASSNGSPVLAPVKGYHAKNKHDLWVVQMDPAQKRMPKDAFEVLKTKAKENNGYWSQYKSDGAIVGFQFKTVEDATRFQEAIGGGTKPEAGGGERFSLPARTVSNEEKELTAQLDAALTEQRNAKASLKNKRADLNKRLQADAEDLFGERKSAAGAGLFDVRADSGAAANELRAYEDRVVRADKEVQRLQRAMSEVQGKEGAQGALFSLPMRTIEQIAEARQAGEVEDAKAFNEQLEALAEEGLTDGAALAARGELFSLPLSISRRAKVVVQTHKDFLHKTDDWIGNKDMARLHGSNLSYKFQKSIQESVGPKPGIFSGREAWKKQWRDVDKAIHIYIDTKRNPHHLDLFEQAVIDAKATLKDPNATAMDIEGAKNVLAHQETVELSQKLTAKQKAIADEISAEYEKIGKLALDEGIIKDILDNYVNRAWDFSRGSSEEFFKFSTFSRHSLPRQLETVLEGFSRGYNLKIEGASNALGILYREINNVVENQRLLKQGLSTKDANGVTLFTTSGKRPGYALIENKNFRKWEPEGKISGYTASARQKFGRDVMVSDKGVVLRKKEVYAPIEIARSLNNILGKTKHQSSFAQGLTMFNAAVKQSILSYSGFHYIAFTRAHQLSQKFHPFHTNPFTAYKTGLKMIAAEDPLLQLLVRNGLTISRQQDFQEGIISHNNWLNSKIDEIGGAPKWVKDKILAMNHEFHRHLFEQYGAGLKAFDGIMRMKSEMKRNTGESPEEIAVRVAKIMNDTYGGLNWARMHGSRLQNPTVRHRLSLALLAPDWTMSNLRLAVKAFQTGQEGHMYRAMWAKVLLNGITLTALLNAALACMDDEDDKGNPLTWEEAMKRRWQKGVDAGHLRWSMVDITPLYHAIPGSDQNKRAYFSIFGAYSDPVRMMAWHKHPAPGSPVELGIQDFAEHKFAVVTKMSLEAVTGENWKHQQFTTLDELLGIDDKGYYERTVKGHYKGDKKPDGSLYKTTQISHRKGDPKGGKNAGQLAKFGKPGDNAGILQRPSTMPSWFGAQVRGLFPTGLQAIMAAATGENDWAQAAIQAPGTGVVVSVDPDKRDKLKRIADEKKSRK